ncbi:MAG: hypothetical protein ABW119_14460 [Candidatus Thiodiazotropha lotti]
MAIDVIINPIAEHIETFQTLWAGILGFLGIMYTLHKNSENQLKLQAEQKKHEQKLWADQIKHEADTLRVALKAELILNKESYEYSIRQFEQGGDYSSNLIRNKVFNSVYTSLIDKIGALSEDEVDKVVRAYRVIDEVPHRLKFLKRRTGGDKLGGDNSSKVTGALSRVVGGIFKAFLKEIDGAIQTIDKNLGEAR